MTIVLHHEYKVTVVAVRAWGLVVELENGTRGLIDNLKNSAWELGGRSSAIGDSLLAVVIDNERDPVRLSTLDLDLKIARMRRSEASEGTSGSSDSGA